MLESDPTWSPTGTPGPTAILKQIKYMNRRQFFSSAAKLLGAMALVKISGVHSAPSDNAKFKELLQSESVIRGNIFHITEPMHIFEKNVDVKYCTFYMHNNSYFRPEPGSTGIILDCKFQGVKDLFSTLCE